MSWNNKQFLPPITDGPSTIELKPATDMYEVTEAIGNVGPIMCTADCKPTCTMAWSRPNLSDINLANLYLEKIDRSQAGNYKCTATNTIASKSSIITVVVNCKYMYRYKISICDIGYQFI